MIRAVARARWLRGTLVSFLLTVGPAPARAQSATGSIEGLVFDQTGAVLPGVTITVLAPAIGVERHAHSNAAGFFRAPLLPVGIYEVAAVLPGFARRKIDVRLGVGQTLTLRLELGVAALAETVAVSAAPPVLETSRTHASSVVEEVSVRHLPVNGRNFIDFVLLTPGVTRDVRGGDLSFAGQRGTINSLIVDGTDNNHTFAGQALGRGGSGRAPYQFSQEAVKEFQVNSNAFSAEYGRAGGAVINVVTKSGSNELHGSAFEFYRDKALNATNAINVLNKRPKDPYHYHQFGATLGGPLRLTRDFFFGNYDGQRNRLPNDVFLDLPATTPDDPATVAAIEELRPKAFSWSRRFDQDVYLFRTDHQLTAKHRLTFRYNHQNFTGEGLETDGAQNAFEHTGASLVRTRTLNASWAAVLASNTFNELRYQYAHDNEPGEANSDAPEAEIRQDGVTVLIIGRNNFSPRENTFNRLQVADTVTWSIGAHKVKAGLDFQFDQFDNFFPGFFAGSYTFPSLAAFAQRRATRYQQHFPGPGTSGARSEPNLQEYSLFVQHEWRMPAGLTLNAGLRYDLMKLEPPPVRNPDEDLAAAGIDTSRLEPDTNNWGPRLGVAWSPSGRRYVLRAGFGFFYGRTPASLATVANTNGINTISLTLTGPDVPRYPDRLTEIPASMGPPNILYIDEGFANPRLLHGNLAFEWEIARDTTLAATFLFVDGRDLQRSIDRNLGTVIQRTYTVAGSSEAITVPFFRFEDRPFRNFQRVIALESSAESRYKGLTIELNRRLARGMHFRAAYTVGQVVDTVPDATAILPGFMGDDVKFASNPLDFEVDRTAGNNDQRHRLVASGYFSTDRLARAFGTAARTLTAGWSFSGIFTAQSGLPFSARIRGDLNGDGNIINDLAPGTRRNAFRLPAIVAFDARVAREIPLAGRARAHLIWEAFNLLNRANFNSMVAVYYNLLQETRLSRNQQFGQPRSSAGERIMQLAVKVSF